MPLRELKNSTQDFASSLISRMAVPLVMLAAMWIIFVLQFLTNNALGYFLAIHVRDFSYAWTIFTAPFVHWSFSHILNNSLIFLILSWIISIEGTRRYLFVTLVSMVVSGVGALLLSMPGTVTGGMSGVIFGYAAYIFTIAFAETDIKRKIWRIGAAIIVISWWGMSFLSGFIPQPSISWQAHIFGALGGFFAAWLVRKRS